MVVVVVVMTQGVGEVVVVLVMVVTRGVVMGDHLVDLQAMGVMTRILVQGLLGQELLLQIWTPSTGWPRQYRGLLGPLTVQRAQGKSAM